MSFYWELNKKSVQILFVVLNLLFVTNEEQSAVCDQNMTIPFNMKWIEIVAVFSSLQVIQIGTVNSCVSSLFTFKPSLQQVMQFGLTQFWKEKVY